MSGVETYAAVQHAIALDYGFTGWNERRVRVEAPARKTAFSEDQHRHFFRDGFVHLPRVVPTDEIGDMNERLWSLLERRGQTRDDPSTWNSLGGSRLKAMRKADRAPTDNPVLREVLDTVFGDSNWGSGQNWAQVLLTWPDCMQWTVPKSVWHVDSPHGNLGSVRGVNVLLMVSAVEAGGSRNCVVRRAQGEAYTRQPP